MAAEDFFNSTAVVRRPAQTAGSVTGATVGTLSTALTAQACTYNVRKPTEIGGPAQATMTEYDFYFSYGANVQKGDVLSSVTGLTNQRLVVKSGQADDAGRNTYARFIVVHRQGGGER